MKKCTFQYIWFVLLILIMTACSSQTAANSTLSSATEIPTPAVESYTDPFAYCAAVGTIDTPDGRYTGDKVPDAVINGFKDAAGLQASTEPMDLFKQTTIWRCMDHSVYVCNFGANLPCSSKANTDKTPTQAMQEYCAANPGSDFIPMSVSGHETIYSWHCTNTTPEILDQIDQADAAGYLQRIWYKIEPKLAGYHPTDSPTP